MAKLRAEVNRNDRLQLPLQKDHKNKRPALS